MGRAGWHGGNDLGDRGVADMARRAREHEPTWLHREGCRYLFRWCEQPSPAGLSSNRRTVSRAYRGSGYRCLRHDLQHLSSASSPRKSSP